MQKQLKALSVRENAQNIIEGKPSLLIAEAPRTLVRVMLSKI